MCRASRLESREREQRGPSRALLPTDHKLPVSMSNQVQYRTCASGSSRPGWALGAYESLVREYAGDLDDIPELTKTDVEEITDHIKEKVKKRKFSEAFQHAAEQLRRGAPISARLVKVRRVVVLLFCHLQTFADEKTFTLFSAPLCSQGHAEGGCAASASSAASASTTADVLGGQSSGNPPPTRAAALARSLARSRERSRERLRSRSRSRS